MNHANNPIPFDEQQLTRLGLLHPPFTDANFRFEGADIEATRNLAVHMLQSSNRVIILNGPPGVGRTALLRQIAATDPDELDCCLLDGSPQLRVANIVKILAMRMGASEVAHDPDTLATRLRQAEASGYRPALLIDDAHRLEENMIKGLLLLREAITKAGGRLPILLAAPTGTDSLLRLLTSSVAEQDERSDIVLSAFTEAQTASYLDQSLAAAGEHTGELLSIRQKQQIHEQAGGIAALINQATVRLLTDSSTDRKRDPSRRSRLLYAGVAAAVILVAGGLALTRYLGGSPPATESPAGTSLALPSQQDNAPAGSLADTGTVGAGAAETPSEQPSFASGASPASPEAAPVPGTIPAPGATGSGGAQQAVAEPKQTAPETGPATTGTPLQLAPSTARNTPGAAKTPSTASEQPVNSADTLSELGTPATEAARANTTESNNPPASTSTRSNQHQEKVANATKVAQRSPAPTAGASSPEDWLAYRSGGHYTIQLIAGYQKQTLERFLKRHPQLEGKTHVVKARRHGRAWHVLVTGDYPSREAARNAVRRLPQALRENGSWVRSFASLRS